jgi:hypothetical protein
MYRRQYLVLAGGAVTGLSGCSSGDEPVEGGDHNTTGSRREDEETTAESTNTPTATETIAEPTNTATATPTSTTTQAAEAVVAITDSKLATRETALGMEAYVIATFENEGERTSGEVSATARFYDDNENLLGDVIDTLPYLKPDETWKVYLPYLDDGAEVKSHKIDGEYQPQTPNIRPDGVKITNATMEKEEYDAVVSGVLENHLEETADYFAAKARFWRDGVILAGGLDNQTDIPAGENWAFEATYSGYGDRWKEATDFDVIPEVTIF